MQWESTRNESFTRHEVRSVGYSTRIERQYSESSNGRGLHVNGSIANGTDSLQQKMSQRTVYMTNGDSNSDSAKFPFKKRGSDASDTGSLHRTYSIGSSGRKSSNSSVGSTNSVTKKSSITMPIRSSSFTAGRRISSDTEPTGKIGTPKS